MCLLETFDHMDQSFLDSAIDQERNFTDAQLTRAVDKKMLYKACGYKFLDEKYNWGKSAAISKFEDHENALESMHAIFRPKFSAAEENIARPMTADDIIEELESLYAEGIKKKKLLQ